MGWFFCACPVLVAGCDDIKLAFVWFLGALQMQYAVGLVPEVDALLCAAVGVLVGFA